MTEELKVERVRRSNKKQNWKEKRVFLHSSNFCLLTFL